MASKRVDTAAQLQCMQQGGPFEVIEVAVPSPAADQVLIRLSVIALNGLDPVQRDRGLFVRSWPRVLGIEGAGIIEAVGTEITEFSPGDEVMAYMLCTGHGDEWGGSYQELVVVPASCVTKKPAAITMEEAASLMIGYITAVAAIHSVLGIPLPFLRDISTEGSAPESILVLGGSSVCGAAVIQLLRTAYPQLPIYATCSTKHHTQIESLGATKVFDYHSESVVYDIKAASLQGRGVDVIIDCVGAGAQQTDISRVFKSTDPKLYAAIMNGAVFPRMEGVTKLDVYGVEFVDQHNGAQVFSSLTELIEQGRYRVPLPVKVVGNGLEQIPDVMDQVKTASGQKLVVKV